MPNDPTDLPEGLTIEKPPTTGSKDPHVRAYKDWLEANPKTDVRLPDFTGDEAGKQAQATAAAFNRVEGMHATYKTIEDGLVRVWVVYDPERAKQPRGGQS